MKSAIILGAFWLIYLGCIVEEILSVPLAILNNNDLGESLEDEGENSPLMQDDDITTRGLARLSSAATCLVAGIEYTHGQQIYRADQCEFCLCLDGEMFCWWQDCPPTLDGPCKNQSPFSPCTSIPVAPTSGNTQPTDLLQQSTTSTIKTTNNPNLDPINNKSSTSTILSINITTTDELPLSSSTILINEANDNNEYSTILEEDAAMSSSTLKSEESSTEKEVKICIVLGQEYKVGESLPHSTGNCLECICGQGGKISCSPHQCVSVGDEINDYRQPDDARRGGEVFK